MTLARIGQQVRAILESNGLRWHEQDTGLALRFSSAIVHVTLAKFGDQALIQLRSNVLCDLGRSDDVLHHVNNLNSATLFGKWVYYADERIIALEYDLLGDHLQEEELMTALAAVARLADRHDDLLQAQLGGRKSVE